MTSNAWLATGGAGEGYTEMWGTVWHHSLFPAAPTKMSHFRCFNLLALGNRAGGDDITVSCQIKKKTVK